MASAAPRSSQVSPSKTGSLSPLLEGTLARAVELVTRESLSTYIGPRILEEAEDVAVGA